jgi:hypothetical protein
MHLRRIVCDGKGKNASSLTTLCTDILQFGRRKPLIIGGLWQSAWLFVFAAAGTAGDPENDKKIGQRERLVSYFRGFQDLTTDCSDDRFCMLIYPGVRDYMGSVSPPLR